MTKSYLIRKHKRVITTYRVYAKDKKEAVRKYNSNQDCCEIYFHEETEKSGSYLLDFIREEPWPAISVCTFCEEKFYPKSSHQCLCDACAVPPPPHPLPAN